MMDLDSNLTLNNEQIIIDNDSGYVSRHQESNSSVTNELTNDDVQEKMVNVRQFYISEDALLEKPNVNCYISKNTSLNDSEVIDASQSTISTNYSGFLEEQSSLPASEKSAIIKELSPILYRNRDDLNISDISVQQMTASTSTMNDSIDMSLDSNGFNTTASQETSQFDLRLNSFIAKQNILKESLNQSGDILTTTPKKQYRNDVDPNLSPELFSEEEDLEAIDISDTEVNVSYKENYIHKYDQILMRRVQKGINGLLPPPSLKVVTLTATDMLDRLQKSKHLFLSQDNLKLNEPSSSSSRTASACTVVNISSSNLKDLPDSNMLLKRISHQAVDISSGPSVMKQGVRSALNNCNINEAKEDIWPDILSRRHHGLHHNRSKVSEKFEDLCTKYALKYVGGETQSTCTIFEINNPTSPSKRRNKLRWTAKSPGRRLSHLARRRITFSSANLQNNSDSRQILIDTKRIELLSRRRSPRKKSPRKTPRKSPRKSPRKRVRTPSSSTKKFIENYDHSGPSTSLLRATSTKRALFESPQKDNKFDSKQFLLPPVSKTGRSPFKKLTPKRALFTSPIKHSPTNENKRKRTLTDNEERPAKLPRSISMVDSKSRCETVAQMSRARSEAPTLSLQNHQTELSELHKKKLQWAVYEALKTQKIGVNHPQYKTYACNLARVTRRFLPNLSANVPRPEGGTSERMLRIARQHVFAVTRGKTVDEIIQNVLESRAKILPKPIGYVSVDDDRNIKNKENIFHDTNNIVNGTTSNDKKKLFTKDKVKMMMESKIDRVRKVINFDGDKR